MSRSLFVSHSSCVLVVLLLTPSSAVAQGFTEADLVGDYAFLASTEDVESNTSRRDEVVRLTGRLTFDGLGNVAGSRTFERTVHLSGPVALEIVQQEVSGSYSVEAGGVGVVTLEATPNPNWIRNLGGFVETEFEPPETLRFALADGGRRLLLTWAIPVRELDTRSGPDTGLRSVLPLVGHAEAQAPRDDLAERVDLLTDLVARQTAQLCEVLRLLNTPQGQRATDSAEVVDACGTGYEWNGEGTDGPRRGR